MISLDPYDRERDVQKIRLLEEQTLLLNQISDDLSKINNKLDKQFSKEMDWPRAMRENENGTITEWVPGSFGERRTREVKEGEVATKKQARKKK